MKRSAIPILIFITLSWSASLRAQGEGEKLFKQTCAACHTINQGKLIGPDLANVQERRSEDWLINFIRSSQSMVKKGDPTAVQVFKENNQIIMPDNNLSDGQIKSILDYISVRSSGEAPGAAALRQGRPLSEATEENIRRGERLFTGQTRLANKGASCISCHNVQDAGIMAGGALARDLTQAFTRLNDAGIRAVLGSPPFPAMQQAYQNKPLTQEEIFDLTAFLQEVDKKGAAPQQRNYALNLLVTGLGGALVLLIFFGGLWMRSKRHSVNKRIYERQTKSV